MSDSLLDAVRCSIATRVDAYGFAPAERFEKAPPEHHPSSVCKDAHTVIVYGKAVPRSALSSPGYDLHLLQRSYHTVYPFLDQVGLELANLIEAAGYLAAVVPSYAPMVFHGLEPWGLISLKHAAKLAGIGDFGRNRIIHNPEFGTMLRFGAVITSAAIAGDPIPDREPCPRDCNACVEACPSGALQERSFEKMVCLGYSIKHGLYRSLLSDDYGRENIEMIINTAGYNYWIDCDECLKVCPNSRGKKRS